MPSHTQIFENTYTVFLIMNVQVHNRSCSAMRLSIILLEFELLIENAILYVK